MAAEDSAVPSRSDRARGNGRQANASPAAAYENRALFSDHYLAVGASELPEWSEDPGSAWKRASQLLREKREILPYLNEAQTEEEWVKPILSEVLGWSYSVQPDATLFGKRNRPDYVLFASPAAKAAAHGPAGPAYHAAAAIADAKYWARPLDRAVKDDRDSLTNANPSFQIVTYLVATGVDWGILTNGKEWRLYSMRARSRVDTYYGVDLEEILENGNAEAFRWFWLFFRAAALRRDAAGESFLDRMLSGSSRYGAELEETLKRRIYEEVFPHLANGFVRWRREAGLPADTPEALREVYEGTLRLLYRLLFVPHAEARGLLPVHDEHGYGRYSLGRVRARVAEALDRGFRLSDVADDLWNDLAGLFRILDRGDPSLNVPHYNGGLFADTPRNAFLATHRLADVFLYPALERLTRDAAGHFIDYSSLSVQQLGSIYEGVLEFDLRVGADGSVYLHRDKAKRHGTGSYYTPPFVVRHIVESTVGPVLAERAGRFRALMHEIVPRQRRLAELEAMLAQDPARADAVTTRWTAEANHLRRELGGLLPRAVDALLGMRVCDPAMGSGHFLVHATDWITERLIVLLDEFPGNPVLRMLASVRAQIVEALAEQGISLEPERLKDTQLLKRLVVKRCIYGVDLNPMAVELAQLSLWLDSFTIGAPLSFLDHHLKPGNSLVGTTVPSVSEALAASPDLFGGPFAGLLRAAILMRDVAGTADATWEEAALSSKRYQEFERVMAPYKTVLDVWTSRSFANPAARSLILDHGNEVLAVAEGEKSPLGPRMQAALDRARELAGEHRFFHWDLEFPEVFIDLERASWKDDPGFDAVIGNPPYVRQEQVVGIKPYLAGEYADVHDGAADLYIYFYRKGLGLLRDAGRMSYVVTNKWLRAGYGGPLRRYFARAALVEQIVDFGHAPVFPDADVFPCIVVLRKRGAGGDGAGAEAEALVTPYPREALGKVEIGDYVREHAYRVPASRFTAAPWSLEPPEVDALLEKMRSAGAALREYTGVRPYRGVLTGYNEAFLIDGPARDRLVEEDPRSVELLKPYLRGQDVERWSPAWAGMWMIVIRSSENHLWPWTGAPEKRAEELFRNAFPAIHRHLARFEPRLRKRADQGRYWWELRSCAYYDAFERPKIFYPDIAWSSQFSYDPAPRFCNNTVYFLPTDSFWVLAVLNSPLVWYYSWKSAVHGKDEALRLFAEFVETLPVAAPSAEVAAEADAAVGRLIEITSEQQASRQEFLRWLRLEFGIDSSGQKLRSFEQMGLDAFLAETRRRLPAQARRLAPGDLAALTDAYGEYAPRVRALSGEAEGLERRLASLVDEAYGLTPAEVDLLWRTAPPRMPPGSPETRILATTAKRLASG